MTPVTTSPNGISVKDQRRHAQTGLVWMKQVPKEWQKLTIRAITTPKSERNRPDYQLLSVYRDYGVIPKDSRDDNFNRPGNDLSSYKAVMPGDLVLNKMKTWQGSLGISKHQGIVSPAYIVCEVSRNVNSDYLHYLLRSYPYIFEYNRISYGVRENQWDMRYQDFKQIPLYLPTRPEQDAIVAFLDEKLARIDRYIIEKQKEIQLLNEFKSSLIAQVITKGLNPNVTMKESGVEWIGKVPNHWQPTKLKCLTRFQNGFAFKPSHWADVGIPIIRIQNLNGSEEFNYAHLDSAPKSLLVKRGDLLFSWSGNKGTSFGPFIWDRDFNGYLNQHIFKLNNYSLPKKFFYYLLKAVTTEIESRSHGIIGLVHVTKPELGSTFLYIPTDEEQDAIVVFLDQKIMEIDALIRSSEKSIERVNELRQSLIADAVTGKIAIPSVA